MTWVPKNLKRERRIAQIHNTSITNTNPSMVLNGHVPWVLTTKISLGTKFSRSRFCVQFLRCYFTGHPNLVLKILFSASTNLLHTQLLLGTQNLGFSKIREYYKFFIGPERGRVLVVGTLCLHFNSSCPVGQSLNGRHSITVVGSRRHTLYMQIRILSSILH